MPERNLTLIDDRTAQFTKYTNGKSYTVTRTLYAWEADRARDIIERGDIYEIDNFCYAIA